MKVTLRIQRYNPERDSEPYFQEFELEAGDDKERILDLLHQAKWKYDGTLTFRRSCAHGVCGSDAIRINGRNRLACSTLLKDVNYSKPIVIEPIPSHADHQRFGRRYDRFLQEIRRQSSLI